MNKLNSRDSYVIVTALETQRDDNVKTIEEAERQGKNCLFSVRYIEDEHNRLIELIKSHTKKLPKKWEN